MMKVLAVLAVFAMLAAAPAGAQVEDDPAIVTPRAIADLTLDELFERLPEAAGTATGGRIEREILRRFTQSGSPTADLLLNWAIEATEARDFPLALDLLDQIVVLRPGFAEAWNRRATVHYLLDDYSASLADIRVTLDLEPRHFGALAGFGIILRQIGREREAIEVLNRALEINPQLENVRETLEKLEDEAADTAI